MRERIFSDLIRFLLVCIVIIGILYFFYPTIRYEYKNSGESNLLVRIDRFTGDLYRFSTIRGWIEVNEDK